MESYGEEIISFKYEQDDSKTGKSKVILGENEGHGKFHIQELHFKDGTLRDVQEYHVQEAALPDVLEGNHIKHENKKRTKKRVKKPKNKKNSKKNSKKNTKKNSKKNTKKNSKKNNKKHTKKRVKKLKGGARARYYKNIAKTLSKYF